METRRLEMLASTDLSANSLIGAQVELSDDAFSPANILAGAEK